MSDFDIEELGRLAAIYSNAGSTNPCVVLQRQRTLSSEDRKLLETIVARSSPEKVASWREEAKSSSESAASSAQSAALSKEEYLNVAKRDFEHAKKSSVLDFMLNEKLSKK